MFKALAIVCIPVFLLLVSCSQVNSIAPQEAVTSVNIQGTWYSKQVDSASGMAMILYSYYGQDGTAKMGLINGATEEEMFSSTYSVSQG